MSVLTPPSPARSIEGPVVNPALRGPVLLATHGMELSDAPAIAARQLAHRLGRPLHVVTVVEPRPEDEPALDLGPLLDEVVRERAEAQEDAVRRYVEATAAADVGFTVEVRHGRVSREIAAAARERDATIVVLGSAPRHRLVRALAGVRASQVLRLAGVPILAVPTDFTTLPRRIVAAVDFAPPSVRAAFTALLMLGDGGTLTLVHVSTGDNDEELRDLSDERVAQLVARLRAVAAAGVPIEPVRALGDVSDTILEVAEQQRAELIAAGTHGPRLAERLFVGSVATRLLHLSPVAVLTTAAPPNDEHGDWALNAVESTWTDRPVEWGTALDAFSRRNAGRRVMLDVYDLDIGAQVEARGCTLHGAVYDPHDRRIEVMLALQPDGRAHLTRSIPAPRSIAVRGTPYNGDEALEIRHGRGQTVLRFTD
jgi:nucleotide-binding universal stress UspA family protein